MKNNCKVIAFIVAILLLLSSCSLNGFSESLLGENVLDILKKEYKKDFTILSIDDSLGYEIYYTVIANDYPDLPFTFTDYSDGFAGMFAHDDFQAAVLDYAAREAGLETNGEKYDFVIYYSEQDGAQITAEKLKKSMESYYSIVNYCKGTIKKYPTYIQNWDKNKLIISIAHNKYSEEMFIISNSHFVDNDVMLTPYMSVEKIEKILETHLSFD